MPGLSETLRLVISGDSSGAKRALKELEGAAGGTQATMGKTMSGLNKAANVAAVGFLGLAAVIGKSVKDYAEFAMTVAKVSAQTGMGAEATSRFVGQLQYFHADASKAGMAVKTLEKAIYGLETGSKTSIATFGILGLTWDDLKAKSPDQQLTLIRDRLSQIQDPAARSAAAGALLGRGAKDMALWYTASGKAIGDVNKQLDANGQIMSQQNIDDAKKGAEAWKTFTGAMKGVEYSIARGALPALTEMAKIAVVLIRALRPFAPLLVPLTIGLGGFVAVVKTMVFFQKTWNQLLTLLPGKLTKVKVAEISAALADKGLTVANLAVAASYVAIGIAAAAAAVAIYKAVEAALEMIAAQKQAIAAGNQGKATESDFEAKIAAKYGRGSAKYNQEMQAANIGTAGQYAQQAKSPWYWGPSAWVGNAVAGFANEGIVKARPGGTVIRVAEAGEDEAIVKTSRLGGLHLHFHGPVVGGEAGMRELTQIVNRQLGPQVAALARGG